MHLCKLNLRDFRNYESLSLDFDPGVNLIVGNNAQGKTNLIEAIAYAGSGKSFRALKQSEMVRFGADFADIEAEVSAQERSQTLRWVIFNGSRPRQIWRNGAKKKSAGDLAGVLPKRTNVRCTHHDHEHGEGHDCGSHSHCGGKCH